MSRPHQQHRPYLTYLEALDEEHWHLAGEKHHDPIRDVMRDEYRGALLTYEEAAERLTDPLDPELKTLKAALDEKEGIYRTAVRGRLHAAKRSALCFSGGGIRSATFGLGVLQGLAGRGLIGGFDFLSTVSGGGYLGGWLSAWIQRSGLDDVQKQLGQVPEATLDPEPAPVGHLRKYSNYLSPKLGATSADTWALAATVVRNLALNWLVLLPLFAGVLLAPLFAWRAIEHWPVPDWTIYGALLVGLVSVAIATGYVGFDLPSGGNMRKSSREYLLLCLGMLTLSAACLNTAWAWLPAEGRPGPWWDVLRVGKSGLSFWQLAVPAMLVHGGGMLVGMLGAHLKYGHPPKQRGVVAALTATVTGLAAGGLALLVVKHLPYERTGEVAYPRLYAWLGYPIVMLFFMVSAALLVGLTSYQTKDEDREWWSRSGGWMLALTLVWFCFAGLVLFSVEAMQFINDEIGKAFVTLTGLTGATGYAAAKVASSSATPSGRRPEDRGALSLLQHPMVQSIASKLLLPAFLVLLILLLSSTNIHILRWWHGLRVGAGAAKPGSEFVSIEVLALAALYAAISLPASYFINVNKFSLHAMYRQRLIRAYLGASNANRRPHPFTGFDEYDNLPMATMPNRPFHVVNMALNLVGGDNLAWQQRKAAPYSSTRLHTGGCRIGYRPSGDYGGRYKEHLIPITLGTAMTISGAAASPNMGYNSSPMLTAVMMLFNARLGWWLGNPRSKDENVWKKPGPNFGIRAFVDEAFGLTNDKNAWVYLSDGGHFENLGIYEMVSRRCHTIVVSDGGADPGYSYEDLGNAVRKIRVDLGIPIDFRPPQMPMSPTRRKTDVYSSHHCAIASIRYEIVDGSGAPDGTLIYIKPSLNGDEPADVSHYASTDPSFPHQPTADQFFDETQFESYRRLGLHIIDRMCGTERPMTLPEFVDAAEWYRNGEV
jgi:hypothetical protein